jgi:hypothetical protein
VVGSWVAEEEASQGVDFGRAAAAVDCLVVVD